MTSEVMYRQGDVLVVRLPDQDGDVSGSEIPRESGRIVLAHGEATGHAHAIASKDAAFFEAPDKRRYLRVIRGPVSLSHEEHRAVDIPPGLYEVRRQREYSPEEIRNVAD